MFNKIKNYALVFLVTALCLVFVIQFGGPQAQGCTSASNPYVAKVYGETVTLKDFEAVYALSNFKRYPDNVQQALNIPMLLLDGMVDAMLLAREADSAGLRVTEHEVMDHLVSDSRVHLSLGVDAPSFLPQGELAVDLNDKEGKFDPNFAKLFIKNYLGWSVAEFGEEQSREMLADQFRTLVKDVIPVSEDEVWHKYVEENDTAKISYVVFPHINYRPTQAQINAGLDAWMKNHQAKIDEDYESIKYRYTNLEPQVFARHILIKVAQDAPEADVEAARKKAADILAKAKSGANFDELARKYSEDTGSAKEGGELGYNVKGRMVPEFDTAQFALKDGEISDLVRTQFGFHIIKREAYREGDVPLAEAKREIAEGLYATALSGELANADAKALLAAWKSGTPDAVIETKLKALPAFKSDPDSIRIQTSENMTRAAQIMVGLPGAELNNAVFNAPEGEAFAAKPFGDDQQTMIFRIDERHRPDREAFDGEQRETLAAQVRTAKQNQAMRVLIYSLRDEAQKRDALAIRPEVVKLPAEGVPVN